jgi:hypothetical protein
MIKEGKSDRGEDTDQFPKWRGTTRWGGGGSQVKTNPTKKMLYLSFFVSRLFQKPKKIGGMRMLRADKK